MERIGAGDLEALEELARRVEDFPLGKDGFIERYWITSGIGFCRPEVLAWMIGKGVPVNFRDDEGYTPLHTAIEQEGVEKYEMMRLLIEAGADVDAHGVNDWTPAHLAAARNDVEALKILRSAGADFSIRTRIDHYATPLEEVEILGWAPEAVAYLKGSGPFGSEVDAEGEEA